MDPVAQGLLAIGGVFVVTFVISVITCKLTDNGRVQNLGHRMRRAERSNDRGYPLYEIIDD